MKTDLEMYLSNEGDWWVAKNEQIKAIGRTLPELDDNLKSVLLRSKKFKKGSRVKVFMGFDFSTIPTWLRQYTYHYFNRIITIDL